MSPSTESASIRVLILSDSPITRSGLRSILECQKDMDLIAEETIASSTTSIDRLLVRRPDVILFDFDRNSIAKAPDTHILKKFVACARIVVLCALGDGEAVKRFLTLGCASVVLKSQPPAALVAAIQSLKGSVDSGSSERGPIQTGGGHCSTFKAA